MSDTQTQKMRQIEYGSGGGPDAMRIVEVERPRPAPGQILIEVHYAGVNGPDLMQRQGHYPPPPGASPVLGLEVAGRVTETGAQVTEWEVRDLGTRLGPVGADADYCLTYRG